MKKKLLTGMSGPRDTSDPSSPGGIGVCYLADVCEHEVDLVQQRVQKKVDH